MRYWKAVFVSVLFAAAGDAQSTEGVETLPLILAKLDVACILKSWRIKGVRVCFKGGKPVPCVIVENAYPVGILESVKKPFASRIKELGLVLKPLSKIRETTSSHTSDSFPASNLHYSETRVVFFVPVAPAALPIAVPPIRGWSISYVSEPDFFAYRNPILELLLKAPQVAQTLPCCDTKWPASLSSCAGPWGSAYPRVGFVNHPSSVMAAFLQMLRAGRIASDPSGRVVSGHYPYEPRTGHYFQAVSPRASSCFKIGDPQVLKVERGQGSIEQGHVLIHYGIFEECKPCFDSRLVQSRRP